MSDDTTNGEQEQRQGGEVPKPQPPAAPPVGEHGFPENTPLAEMTVEQREAYWKDKARKHEARAEARSDYEQVKAENERLRQQHETETEKAVREARDAGATEERERAQNKTLAAMARMGLRARGITDDGEIASFVNETNLSAFLTEDGQVDDTRLMARVDRYAGTAGGKSGSRPDMGQGHRGGYSAPSGLRAGADLYDKQAGKTTTTH